MKSYNLFTISFAILIMISTVSSADTFPPELPLSSHSVKTTLKEKVTGGMLMGTFRVQFEKTTLDDIRKITSAGEISHQGDAGDSVYWLCYTNQNAKQIERIWIISDGEMGGLNHAVTHISAEVLLNGQATTDCPYLPKNLLPLSLDNNLWLNSSTRDVLKTGAPSFQKEAWRSFYYEGGWRF
jgi:hypothetical protein